MISVGRQLGANPGLFMGGRGGPECCGHLLRRGLAGDWGAGWRAARSIQVDSTTPPVTRSPNHAAGLMVEDGLGASAYATSVTLGWRRTTGRGWSPRRAFFSIARVRLRHEKAGQCQRAKIFCVVELLLEPARTKPCRASPRRDQHPIRVLRGEDGGRYWQQAYVRLVKAVCTHGTADDQRVAIRIRGWKN